MAVSYTVRAPASVGNVCVGYDVLGHAFAGLYDEITARRTETPGVTLRCDTQALTTSVEGNTAGGACLSVLQRLRVSEELGVELEIRKGIPLCGGLGGSAASAVAAAYATALLLQDAADHRLVFQAALDGETIASGARHADNVAPVLYGGLQLCFGEAADQVTRQIQLPSTWHAAVVTPDHAIATRDARAVTPTQVRLSTASAQAADLAAFVYACTVGDADLLKVACRDRFVEPYRASLLPGYERVKAEAFAAGAMCAGFSGAGPSCFAWASSEKIAYEVANGMSAALANAGLSVLQASVSPIQSPGVEVIGTS